MFRATTARSFLARLHQPGSSLQHIFMNRRRRPRPPAAAASAAPVPAQVAAFATAIMPTQPKPAQPTDAARHFSSNKFVDAPISQASKNSIKHEFMTDVQAATLKLALEGKDLLVQAKTGTGKTLAFLLPAVERLLQQRAPPRPGSVSILVMSPTRELACQIEDEAQILLRTHPFKVQHAIGGTNIKTELNRLTTSRCDILVATPGRLLDLMETHGLHSKFTETKILVLDEADRLLDQGFKRELDKIFAYLPPKEKIRRQTLLFSATISREIKEMASKALVPNHTFISTLQDDEINTHEHVSQSHLVVPFTSALPATVSILRHDLFIHPGASKVMVFFPTARHVSFAAAVLSQIGDIPEILEIHSRKSQPARTKAADRFKEAPSAILLSSDVAARGMDFPGVTLVLQVGLPANSEQYVHRLGRTARAGAAGRGVLVLSQAELFFLRDKTIASFGLTPLPASAVPLLDESAAEIAAALGRVDPEVKASAYRAWIGYYNGHLRNLGWSKEQLVQEAETYVREALGWSAGVLPGIEPRAVGMMGLRGIAGLNVTHPSQRTNRGVRGPPQAGQQRVVASRKA